ncbi:hypothetical protein ACWGBV_36255, partial [Streptomyces sp. NPDC055051]
MISIAGMPARRAARAIPAPTLPETLPGPGGRTGVAGRVGRLCGRVLRRVLWAGVAVGRARGSSVVRLSL